MLHYFLCEKASAVMLCKWFAWMTLIKGWKILHIYSFHYSYFLFYRRSVEELLKLLPGPHLDLKRVSGLHRMTSHFREAIFFREYSSNSCRVVRLIRHWKYSQVQGLNRVLTGLVVALWFWLCLLVESHLLRLLPSDSLVHRKEWATTSLSQQQRSSMAIRYSEQ